MLLWCDQECLMADTTNASGIGMIKCQMPDFWWVPYVQFLLLRGPVVPLSSSAHFWLKGRITKTMTLILLLTTIVGLVAQLELVSGQCFNDESMNTQWAQLINGDANSTEFSIEGSCCQETVCALPCPADQSPPAKVREILFFYKGGLNNSSYAC